ncbi:MAG: hypothetical protein Q9190_005731 [Brigantiaea leucoxantha]
MTSNPNFNSGTGAKEAAAALGEFIRSKTVLVTGVNPGGLGAATAHAIASQSPELLILTYRTKEKIEKVVADLRNAYSSTKIATLQIDLADVDSVRRAAKEVHVMTGHIDVLVNNAGVMSVQDKTTTSSGIEIQFATNHLGHFLFTNLIMDLLLTAAQKASRPGSTRIINLSGGWHQFSPVRFDDINFDREQIPDDQKPNAAALAKFGLDTKGVYIPEVAYAQSKTANILFSVYLTQHLREAGVISFALNPGGIMTEIGRHLQQQTIDHLLSMEVLDKDQDQGSSTTIVAAFDPLLTGSYL